MSGETPHSISDRAADDLTFIRSAMERSAAFTAVPGLGGVVIGAIGFVAAAIAARAPDPETWLMTWLVAAFFGLIVELGALIRKARRTGLVLTGLNARRFALGIAAPLVAGAALTCLLWTTRGFTIMAPLWLLLYGSGVLSAGMFSVPVVRALGLCFMATGLAAAITPPEWGNMWLAVGFGGLHVGFGAYIARNLGG